MTNDIMAHLHSLDMEMAFDWVSWNELCKVLWKRRGEENLITSI